MAIDPVVQWRRIVNSWRERDWETAAALTADDFRQTAVAGAVYNSMPRTFDKSAQNSLIRDWAERFDLSHETKALAGLDDTIVTIFEERLNNGVSWTGYAIVRFNDEGQMVELYSANPHLQL